MGTVQLIRKIAKHEKMKKEDLLKESIEAYLLEKKRQYLREKFEILSRYNISSSSELKKAIRKGEIPEHPSWEDFIEAQNIDIELKEIENDIRHLQKD